MGLGLLRVFLGFFPLKSVRGSQLCPWYRVDSWPGRAGGGSFLKGLCQELVLDVVCSLAREEYVS